MLEITPNLWALIACLVVRVVIGGLWYSPLLFVKSWQSMAGVSDAQMKKGMGKAVATDVILSLIMAFVLLHAIRYALPLDPHNLSKGLAVSFANWLGLVVPIQAGAVTYENKPLKYFLINSGYQLLSILAMGAILTLWD